MDLDELQSGRAGLAVTYKGQVAHIEYQPERVGMNLQRAMIGAQLPPYDVGPLVDNVTQILISWDLKRGGEVIPVTAEAVGSLPMGLMSEIGRAIMQDFQNPKSPAPMARPSESSMRSPASSEPAAALATVPTSPSPSSTPDGPASPPGTS